MPYVTQFTNHYASYSYFIKLWNITLSHVRMTRKQRYSMCKICAEFNDQIIHHLHNKNKKNIITDSKYFLVLRKSIHLEQVRNARRTVLFW